MPVELFTLYQWSLMFWSLRWRSPTRNRHGFRIEPLLAWADKRVLGRMIVKKWGLGSHDLSCSPGATDRNGAK